MGLVRPPLNWFSNLALLSSNLYDADEDRELSPEMESQDAIQLLPELAAIQKNVRASSAVPEPIESRSVELHVKWVPHPVHPQPYESVLASWTFNVPLVSPMLRNNK